MAIKFYGGHQLNPKTQLFGTKTALRTIEVDVDGNELITTSTSTSNDVSLLIDASATGDGSVVDSSTNSHPITVNGDVSQSSFSPYRSGGYSWEFTGQGNYLSVPNSDNSSDYDLRNVDFTVEFFMNLNGSNHSNNPVIMGGQQGWYVQLKNSDSRITFYDNSVEHHADVTLDNSSWYHVAITRSGSTLKTFLNGLEVYSGNASTSDGRMYNSDFLIASYSTNPDLAYIGLLSDIRVVKGTALYTENFTPPTERLTEVSGTSLLACNLPYLQSGLTAHGNVSSVAAGPYDYAGYSESLHGGSYVFDGNGDYLSMPASSDFDFGSSDFTIEAWVNVDLDSINYNLPLVGWGNGSYKIIRLNSSGINVESPNPSNATFNVSFPSSPNTRVWNHIALVRSGNTFTAYLNGKGGTAYTSFTGSVGNSSDSLRIGYKSDPAYYPGRLSDLRIVKGTAVYTTDFTPPTAPLTGVAGTSILLSGNNAAIRDESQTAEKLTVHGSISPVDSSPYGSGKSMGFNGSYITSSEGIDFSDNDFTIELWWYPTSTGRQGLFHGSYGADWSIGIDYNSTYNNPTIGFWASSTGGSWDIANSDPGGNGVTTGEPVQNAWNHIAYVRNGSTLTLYLNGVNVGEVTGVTAPIHSKTNTHQQTIGTWWKATGWGGGPMSGNVADYRISLEAVYTADFDVPTAPFDGATPAVSSQVSLHLNGTDSGIVDGSSNSHAVTTNGNVAVVEGSPYDSTTSMSFDGNGDYLTVGDANLLDITSATQSFTVEAWVNQESRSVGGEVYRFTSIVSKGVVYVSFGITASGALQFYTYDGGFNTVTSASDAIPLNEWTHVAIVCDSGSITLYKNGTSIATGSLVVPTGGTNVSPKIGAADPAYASDFFHGKMADLRIIDGTAVAPTAAPTSALTGSAGSQVVFAELSTTDVKSSYPPVITNDSLTASASTSQDVWSHGRATMSFTSGKYYWEAIPNGNGMIGLELDTADGDRATFNGGTDVLAARDGWIRKDNVEVVSGQSDWTDGDVVGIAVDGDTGLVQFYINGVESMSYNTGWGSDKVKIPAYAVYKNGSNDWSWTFNFGAGGFAYSAPEGYQALGSASPITASLLISGNGGVSDASSSSHTLTLNGDVTTALGSPFTSGNVITFDGNGDFAHISNADFSYGTGDFTIEAWINSDDVTASGPRNIFTQRSQGGPVLRLWNSKLHYMRGEGQNALYSAENLLTAGQWHHVALVRSSGVVSIYLDGTSVASQAETYDFSSLTEVYVGSYGSQYEFFDGEIADFRITKAAVYTENFSVPTATLGDYPPPPVRYYKTEIIPPAPTVTFTGNATDSAELEIDDTISLNAAAVGMGYHSTSFTVGQSMIMEMHLWGAGGGGTKRSSNYTGGNGGYSTGRYTFVPGVEYQVVVGGGGEGGSQDPASNTAYGALATGGGANEQSTGSEFDGGAGGGYTGVFISEVSQASALIIAGGGGGGSGDIGTGGAGGGLNGGNGSNGGRAGLGGSQTAGGSGSGGPGSALQGGTGLGVGAGGGGGYFGGAGGIASGPGAGGGGSGFISSELTDASTGGLDFNAPYRTDSAGLGGASGQNGVGGLLVLRRIS